MKTTRRKPIQKTNKGEANQYAIVKSPVGDLLLVADADALIGLYFAEHKHAPAPKQTWEKNDRHPILSETAKQLQEYFSGIRMSFSIPLRLKGAHFQEKIWRQIARISYGATTSYSELAARVGAPQAIRAAGTATGRNPISIIIPCHRVLGKNGELCGFAGGIKNKRRLLKLETSNHQGFATS
jgi:methylated-DNA-[protein]-cysteine S-methyltransferase